MLRGTVRRGYAEKKELHIPVGAFNREICVCAHLTQTRHVQGTCAEGSIKMTAEKIKRMLDACYLAKRVRELLPALPEGVTPAYIQYMDVIQQLQGQGRKVKVSDISDTLKLPRPGVTRTVKEMEKKGYLQKTASEEDGRITYLILTEKGIELSEKYDKNYYSQLLNYMDDISEEEADVMIHTIEKFYKVMSERRIHIE